MILTTKVKNKTGIHARPAKVLAQEAMKYNSNIQIKANGFDVNCKSIISLMALKAVQGTEVVINIEGNDEREAYDAIKALFDNNLNENE